MKRLLAILLLCSVGAHFAYAADSFPVTSTKEDLLAKYAAAGAGGEKVRILVMPDTSQDMAAQSTVRSRSAILPLRLQINLRPNFARTHATK